MKKMLILAALAGAAVALPAAPSLAGGVAHPTLDAKCVILPLLPDCLAQWDAKAPAPDVHGTAAATPWWTCKPAAPGAGHLLDCKAAAK